MAEAESAVNIPESLKGILYHVHHSLVQTQTKNVNNIHHQDMQNKIQWNIRLTDEHSAKNAAVEPTSTQPDQPLTVFLPTDDVIMLTEKVGCICHATTVLGRPERH